MHLATVTIDSILRATGKIICVFLPVESPNAKVFSPQDFAEAKDEILEMCFKCSKVSSQRPIAKDYRILKSILARGFHTHCFAFAVRHTRFMHVRAIFI